MSTPMVFTAYVDSASMGRRVHSRLLELCEAHDVEAEVRVVDVTTEPAAAEVGNVVGIPTVVREQPRPRRRVIGALDDSRRVAGALGLDDRPADDGARDNWAGGDAHTNAGVGDGRA